MKWRLTRDSVCAADDCDAPHEAIVEIDPDSPVAANMERIARGYLPVVSGGSTWIAYHGANPLAVLTFNDAHTLQAFVPVSELRMSVGQDGLFFAYRWTEDPWSVAKLLTGAAPSG